MPVDNVDIARHLCLVLVTAVQSAEESHSVTLEPAATCQRSPCRRKEPQRRARLERSHASNGRSSVAAVIPPPCVRDRGRRAGRAACTERASERPKSPIAPSAASSPPSGAVTPAAVRQHVVRARAATAISSSRSRRGNGRSVIRSPCRCPSSRCPKRISTPPKRCGRVWTPGHNPSAAVIRSAAPRF